MNISLTASRALGKSELFFKRNGPTILTGVGIAGFAATTVLVGRAVLKSQPVIKEAKAESEAIRQTFDPKDDRNELTRELGKHWIGVSSDLAKIYWPAILTGSASVVCILSAHGMMKRNQAALAAAYMALDKGYKAYRQRVEGEFGKEKELELYRGIRTVADLDEEGKPCEIVDFSDMIPSPYARFFDETSVNWVKTPEYNLMFLRAQQNWANDRLRAHGYIFLNEVLDALGIPRCQLGQIVGWKEGGTGDGFVDFGIYDLWDENKRAFVNGFEHTVLLDFNVDGPIRI